MEGGCVADPGQPTKRERSLVSSAFVRYLAVLSSSWVRKWQSCHGQGPGSPVRVGRGRGVIFLVGIVGGVSGDEQAGEAGA